MSDTESIRVACPECGKRLRVKATLDGKRLKCPACAKTFEAQPVQAEEDQPSRRSHFPWITVFIGVIASALLVFLAVLWLGARSEFRAAKDQLSTSEEKRQDADQRVAAADKKLQELISKFESAQSRLASLQKKADALQVEKDRIAKQLAETDQKKRDADLVNEKLTAKLAAAEAAVSEESKKAQAALKTTEELRQKLHGGKSDANDPPKIAKEKPKRPERREKKGTFTNPSVRSRYAHLSRCLQSATAVG